MRNLAHIELEAGSTSGKPWGPAVAAALVALVVYAVTIQGTWIFDDVEQAHSGGDTRLTQVSHWKEYLTDGYFQGGADHLWRPLVSLSFAVNYHFFGDKHAWPLHLVNILANMGACAAAAELARRLAGTRVAYVAGMLFAAHPIHVDAVAYIVGRAETIATIGVLGGLVLFLKRPLTVGRAFAIVGCFLLAIFAKEQGLLLPPMLVALAMLRQKLTARHLAATGLLLAAAFAIPTLATLIGPVAMWLVDVYPWHLIAGLVPAAAALVMIWRYLRDGLAPDPKERQAQLWLIFLMSATMSAYIVYRENILPWRWEVYFLDYTINPVSIARGAARWLIPIAILGRYATLLVWPYKLSLDYSEMVFTPEFDRHDPFFYIGLAAIAVFAAALIVAAARRKPVMLFCLIGLAMSYGLVGNFMLIGTVFGERLMYLPSVFFCILVAMALARLGRRALIGVTGVLVVAGSVRAIDYARRWNDRISFYQWSLENQPKSAMLHALYAVELEQAGRIPEAREVLADGRRQCAPCWAIWHASAALAFKSGDLEEAEKFIKVAFNERPGMEKVLRLWAEIKAAQVQRTGAPKR